MVLSRFRSLDGLFVMEPIPDKIDFTPSNDYLDMMVDIRKTILKTPEDVCSTCGAALDKVNMRGLFVC